MILAVNSVDGSGTNGDLTLLLLDLSSSPPPAQQLQNPIRTLGRKRLLEELKMLVIIAGRRGFKRCPHVLHNVAAAVDDGSPNIMVLFEKDDDVVVTDEDSIGERGCERNRCAPLLSSQTKL
jgi:hypothetical protein